MVKRWYGTWEDDRHLGSGVTQVATTEGHPGPDLDRLGNGLV